MIVVNSGDGREYKATFEAYPGVPTIPTTVHWKLYNLTAKKLVQDWTEVPFEIVSDGANIQQVKSIIDIAGSLNTVQSSKNRGETFRLTVRSDMDMPRSYSQDEDYLVRNRDF